MCSMDHAYHCKSPNGIWIFVRHLHPQRHVETPQVLLARQRALWLHIPGSKESLPAINLEALLASSNLCPS